MKHEKSCGAVVYRREGREISILVERMALGHVSIPKGHVEPGETEVQTALREIREETALEVKLDTGFRHVISYSPGPGIEKQVVFFVAEALDGNIRPQESEVKSAVFLTEQDALMEVTHESDRETIAAACEYLRSQGV